MIFFIDFTDYTEGSVEDWLTTKGFMFERDARNRKKIDLDVNENGLVIEAKTRTIGVMLNEGVDIEEFSSIKSVPKSKLVEEEGALGKRRQMLKCNLSLFAPTCHFS